MFGGYGRKHIPREDLNELKAQVTGLDGGVLARAGGGAPVKTARPQTAATPGLRRTVTSVRDLRKAGRGKEDNGDLGSEESTRVELGATAKSSYTAKLLPAHQRVLMNEFGGFKDRLIQKCYEQTLKVTRKKTAEANRKRDDRSVEE